MCTDFKPSTRKLFKILGWEDSRHYRSEEDETYRIHEFVIALMNRAYGEIGPETYKVGSWPADQHIIDALREALPDHQHDYAGRDLAYILVRYGCRRPETMASLHPWDALMFTWQSEGMTAERVAKILQEEGIIEDVPPDAIESINARIQSPTTDLGESYSLLFYIFGHQRIVFSSLRDDGFEPRHDELFRGLASSAFPPVQVAAVTQLIDSAQRFTDVTNSTYLTMHTTQGTLGFRANTHPQLAPKSVRVLSDRSTHWVVQFMHNGKKQAFFAEGNGTWMDENAVITNFDCFMASLGRPERAFRFGISRADSSEYGVFIVADSKRFPEVAEQLHIPLHSYA